MDSRYRVRLRTIARLCGIAVSYENFEGRQVDVPEGTLVRLINALEPGAGLAEKPSVDDLENLLVKIKARYRARAVAPVLVAWDGRLSPFWVWLKKGKEKVEITLSPETGKKHARTLGRECVIFRGEGKRIKVTWPDDIPYGYYRLSVGDSSAFLISAPRRVKDGERSWGFFAPAYALHGKKTRGPGGYRELTEASCFTGKHGGAFFGTLPLLAAYYEGDDANISPYSPITRLFWNEIFLDADGLQDNSGIVHYRDSYAHKKKALMEEADRFFGVKGAEREDYRAFSKSTPYLEDYANFRAASVGDPQGREREKRFHLYVQFACHRHMSGIKARGQAGECAALYLDYPVGVHPKGFDAARFSHLFLNDFYIGAPPDLFYSGGQNWGFHPFHPRALIEDGFAYFRATLHSHFRYARMLRLDHVMGFKRIFCIPTGETPDRGGYIYYPFDAFLAVMALEAHRHDGILIGEDLGTVPPAVREKMEAHNISRMWIFQFEIQPDKARTFSSIGNSVIASLNTHDLFPYREFLTGGDIIQLQKYKLLGAPQAEKLKNERQNILKHWEKGDSSLPHVLEKMAASPARFVMVNVEDIWHETMPQNIPGLTDEYPNWRRKVAVPLEDWADNPDMLTAINALNKRRNRHA